MALLTGTNTQRNQIVYISHYKSDEIWEENICRSHPRGATKLGSNTCMHVRPSHFVRHRSVLTRTHITWAQHYIASRQTRDNETCRNALDSGFYLRLLGKSRRWAWHMVLALGTTPPPLIVSVVIAQRLLGTNSDKNDSSVAAVHYEKKIQEN